MIDVRSKYDKMHRNEMFYALTCINKHAVTSISCMLLPINPLNLQNLKLEISKNLPYDN